MVKIMIPIKENKGRDSIPSDTLGGAPQYYIVDTEGDVSSDRVVDNGGKHKTFDMNNSVMPSEIRACQGFVDLTR